MIGRFISADTIVPYPFNPQSLNRYSYCRNNPMIYVDPSGHFDIQMYPEYGGGLGYDTAVWGDGYWRKGYTGGDNYAEGNNAAYYAASYPGLFGEMRAACDQRAVQNAANGEWGTYVINTTLCDYVYESFQLDRLLETIVLNRIPGGKYLLQAVKGAKGYGSRGKPDHIKAIDKKEADLLSKIKKGEEIKREYKVQGYETNKQPDLQKVKNGRTVEIWELERHPTWKRNRDREDVYRRLGITNHTIGPDKW